MLCDVRPKVHVQKKKNAPCSTTAEVLKGQFPFSTPSGLDGISAWLRSSGIV